MKLRMLAALLLLLVSVCAATLFWNWPTPPSDPALKEKYLRAAVAEELMTYGEIEVPSLRFIRIETDETGKQSLALRASHEEKLKGRSRSEISVDFPFSVGDHLRYTWDFKMDADLAFEYESENKSNKWWVIAQWHDQPNVTLGETWDDFPSHSPAILFSFGKLEGKEMIGFAYGASELRDIATAPFKRGAWHQFELDVVWSQGADGKAVASLDGEVFARAEGQNMFNGFQHYFKAGSYRYAGIKGDGWVHIRNVKIEKLP